MRETFTVLSRRLVPTAKYLIPLSLAVLCLWLVQRRFDGGTWADIGPALGSVGPLQWLAALVATGVSFWALGRYDVVIHRHFGTGCDETRASVAGMSAIALGQTVGMGAVTGAVVRWRLLPELSPASAAKVSAMVAVSFLLGLAFVASVILTLSPVAGLPRGVAMAAILALLLAGLSLLVVPTPRIGRYRLEIPSLPALANVTLWTAVDTIAACLALYFLLPDGTGVTLFTLLPAFLVALGAAILSGTPGGVGPFELVLLTLVPQAAETNLLAGLIGFRAVYYALPAVLAVIVLFRPPPAMDTGRKPRFLSFDETPVLSPRSELGVCRQNGARIITGGDTSWALVQTRQTLTALFSPLTEADLRRPNPTLEVALDHAREHNRLMCLYKFSARHSARLRRRGWVALHVANEAVLAPASVTLQGKPFRQLRRKLKQAEEAGVIVTRAIAPLPLREMAIIDAAWQGQNGAARGLSMGRFCPDYLRSQIVYLAHQDGKLIAYISLHEGAFEMCLDLMRATGDAPSGTMHALVYTAIREAAEDGLTRFSLAALPAIPKSRYALANRVLGYFAQAAGAQGLIQFKTCFAPRLEPLYALARSWPALGIALLDLAQAIRNPDANIVHHDMVENRFDPLRGS